MAQDEDDAPLFRLFWENSELNDARAALLAHRIAADAARPYVPPRPSYARAALQLPKITSDSGRVWDRRESTRTFGAAGLTLEQLSALCHPFSARTDGTRRSPSGGGKYPVRVYAALLTLQRAGELAGALVWYDPIQHGLTPIARCPAWSALRSMLGVEDWQSAPAVVFFMTAQVAVSTEKYGERGGRFVLLEAGAYLGALGYEAARLGLRGVALGAARDDDVLSMLKLDRREHCALTAYACGT